MFKDNPIFSKFEKRIILKKKIFLLENSARSRAVTKKWSLERFGVKTFSETTLRTPSENKP